MYNPLFLFQYAIVIREGEKLNVQAEELCIGDIIDVKFGDRIPADMRVIEARGFKVTEWRHLAWRLEDLQLQI